MGRKRVAKGVATGSLGQASGKDGVVDGALKDGLVKMVAAPTGGRRVVVVPGRRENPLPRPLAVGVGELAVQRVRQLHRASTLGEIVRVLHANLFEVPSKGLNQAQRQHGDPVLLALAVADADLTAIKVEVFYTEPTTLQQAKAGAVQKIGHEPRSSSHAIEHRSNLHGRENHGDALGSLGPHKVAHLVKGHAQDAGEEKEQGRKRLVLGRSTDPLDSGQVVEEELDVGMAELGERARRVKEEKSLDPADVGLLCARTVVARSKGVVDPLEKGRMRHQGSRLGRRRVHAQHQSTERASRGPTAPPLKSPGDQGEARGGPWQRGVGRQAPTSADMASNVSPPAP
jgi:hypothetical protein